jgi:hypothetical protein
MFERDPLFPSGSSILNLNAVEILTDTSIWGVMRSRTSFYGRLCSSHGAAAECGLVERLCSVVGFVLSGGLQEGMDVV